MAPTHNIVVLQYEFSDLRIQLFVDSQLQISHCTFKRTIRTRHAPINSVAGDLKSTIFFEHFSFIDRIEDVKLRQWRGGDS